MKKDEKVVIDNSTIKTPFSTIDKHKTIDKAQGPDDCINDLDIS